MNTGAQTDPARRLVVRADDEALVRLGLGDDDLELLARVPEELGALIELLQLGRHRRRRRARRAAAALVGRRAAHVAARLAAADHNNNNNNNTRETPGGVVVPPS